MELDWWLALAFSHLLQPLLTALLCLLSVFVVLGNLLVVSAIWHEHQLHSVTNYLVASLAAADCLVGSVVMPFSIISEIVMGSWTFGPVWCDLWHSFDVLASTASIMNLCAISLDRYLAITDPISYPSRMTQRRVALLIVSLWTCSSLISFPAILWWRAVGDGPLQQIARLDSPPTSTTNTTTTRSTTTITTTISTTTAPIGTTNTTLASLLAKTNSPPSTTIGLASGGHYNVDDAHTHEHYDTKFKCVFTDDPYYLLFSSFISFYGPLCVMLYAYYEIYKAAVQQTKFLKYGSKEVTVGKKKSFKDYNNKRVSLKDQQHNKSSNSGAGSSCSYETTQHLVLRAHRGGGGGGGSSKSLRKPELYNIPESPHQKRNLFGSQRAVKTDSCEINTTIGRHVEKKSSVNGKIRSVIGEPRSSSTQHHLDKSLNKASQGNCVGIDLSKLSPPIEANTKSIEVISKAQQPNELTIQDLSTNSMIQCSPERTTVTLVREQQSIESKSSYDLPSNKKDKPSILLIKSDATLKPNLATNELPIVIKPFNQSDSLNQTSSLDTIFQDTQEDNVDDDEDLSSTDSYGTGSMSSVVVRTSDVCGMENSVALQSDTTKHGESEGIKTMGKVKNALNVVNGKGSNRSHSKSIQIDANTKTSEQLNESIRMKHRASCGDTPKNFTQEYTDKLAKTMNIKSWMRLARSRGDKRKKEPKDYVAKPPPSLVPLMKMNSDSSTESYNATSNATTSRATSRDINKLNVYNSSDESSILTDEDARESIACSMDRKSVQKGSSGKSGGNDSTSSRASKKHQMIYFESDKLSHSIVDLSTLCYIDNSNQGTNEMDDARNGNSNALPQARKKSVSIHQSTGSSKVGGECSTSRQQKSVGKKLSKLAKERKAAKTLGIVVGVFILCWLPFFVVNILVALCGNNCIYKLQVFVPVVTWLGWLNSAMNPVIYACWSRDFRRAFRRVLCSWIEFVCPYEGSSIARKLKLAKNSQYSAHRDYMNKTASSIKCNASLVTTSEVLVDSQTPNSMEG